MKTTDPAVLVVGATGTTGRPTIAGLVAAGRRVKAGSRGGTPLAGAEGVRFDWYDPATHAPALRDVDGLYLVPPPGDPEPAAVMLPFLRLARDAGVTRVVLLSASAVPAGGPAVGRVHQDLPDLFDTWTVLRPSWFMQNFTGDHLHAESARTEGELRTAAGRGRIGFVDAHDIAAVAVRALTDAEPPLGELVLTGPEALDHDTVAAVLSEVTGREIVHRHLTRNALRDRLAALMPPAFAELLADMDRAIAAGAEDRTTDTVHRITGRPPTPFRTVARRELA
ncbi:ergot alkaloid biosynthesis protein [Streptomyces sp. NPDC097619]|uniref:ergot alkaloid biosynthesis protein n=1 Tax=Streptomyces sp. NPDC097619 TaxID=3157228 RepID=UPI0033333988